MGWSPGQNYFFTQYGHVAYQIKGNYTCVQHGSTDTPSITGVGSKGQNTFFLKVVMLHIKLKGIECRAP